MRALVIISLLGLPHTTKSCGLSKLFKRGKTGDAFSGKYTDYRKHIVP